MDIAHFFRKILINLLFFFGICGCNNDDNIAKLYFIGDSNIKRWDIAASFPNYGTINLGKSGAGIDYLIDLYGSMNQKTIIVLLGANDRTIWDEDYPNELVNRVQKLGARQVFIISILPQNGSASTNAQIEYLNQKIHLNIDKYDNMHFINAYPYFKSGDTINKIYFADDIHLNECGYEVLRHEILHSIQ